MVKSMAARFEQKISFNKLNGGRMDIRGVYRFSSLEVKSKREKLRCLLLRRKKKIIFLYL